MSKFNSITEIMYGLPAVLKDLQYSLPVGQFKQASQIQTTLFEQLHNYLLPRLTSLEAPALAVVGGSTGVGKSTLVNSLVRQTVTPAGVLRPTTKSPVLVYHPTNEMWFNSDRILPGLVRSTGLNQDHHCLGLKTVHSIPIGLAVLDCPDLDSVYTQNSVLAETLLLAADLWLFVTSAARYADVIPWRQLTAAIQRGTSVAIVLNRVPLEAINDVQNHLSQLLATHKMGDLPLFVIPQAKTDTKGLLATELVASLRNWLIQLAEKPVKRHEIVTQTLQGAINAIRPQLALLLEAAEEQQRAIQQLNDEVADSFNQAAGQLAQLCYDGSALVDQLLVWWLTQPTDQLLGKSHSLSIIQAMIQDRMIALIRAANAGAVEAIESAWRLSPAGEQLLDRNKELTTPSPQFETNLFQAIHCWQANLVELITQQLVKAHVSERHIEAKVKRLAEAVSLLVCCANQNKSQLEEQVRHSAVQLLDYHSIQLSINEIVDQAKSKLVTQIGQLFAHEQDRFKQVLDEVELIGPTQESRLTRLRAAVEKLKIELG